jgi:phage baseplate assembly protein W
MAYFIDIDLLLTKNELTNDINFKLDTAAITQAIKNVLLTTKGERLFDKNFGGNAYDLLYNSPNSLELKAKAGDMAAAIQVYEPRVIIKSIDIVDSELGYWIIQISCSPTYDQGITKNLELTVGNDK